MNRSILAAGFFAVALMFMGSCADDDSYLQCPPDKPDPHQLNKFLIATAEGPGFLSRPDTIIVYWINKNLFPPRSEFQSVSLLDSIPPLEVLTQFDAILLYTVSRPIDSDLIGDVMADYVDQGGGLVMCLWSMSDASAGIRGRLSLPGYAPLQPGPSGNIPDDRAVDFVSISYPLHPIFYEIGIKNITYPGIVSIPHPQVDATAKLLAKDNFGANAIAINNTGKIIGLNIWPSYVFSSLDRHSNAAKLISNSLKYTAGLLE